MKPLRKIRIIGSVASGKTTLAKRLSKKFQVPYYELDNVVWKRTSEGDIRYTEDERDAIMKSIIQQKHWIIEGVHNDQWVKKSFEDSDLIILLNIHLLLRDGRIIKRFIRQKIGLEESHYKPTYKMFFKMFKWNRQFTKQYASLLVELNQFEHKIVIVRNKRQLENLFNQFEKSRFCLKW